MFYIVTLYSEYTRALTFQNFWLDRNAFTPSSVTEVTDKILKHDTTNAISTPGHVLAINKKKNISNMGTLEKKHIIADTCGQGWLEKVQRDRHSNILNPRSRD